MAQVSHDIGRPDVNGHYGAGPSNGPHMSQASSGDGIQSNPPGGVPYPGGQIYPNNVVPYGSSSSLLGANVLPVSFHSPPTPQNAHHHQPPPEQHQSPHTPSPSLSKRKSEETSGSTGPRKRRQYVPIGSGLDGIERDEADLGPNGGPKHWTDGEKDTLFHWLLDNDKNWDMFRSKMNTVFRDAATQVFGSRKSFTALKSCYHRNVETFKQIFAFEVYLSRHPDTSGPINEHTTLGNYHDPTMARQVHLEQRLDDARNAGVPVANLNVKVIDHWYQKQWYHLFKKRYVDDGTGQAVPFYGPAAMSFPDGSTSVQYTNESIDPQLTHPRDDEDNEDDSDKDHGMGQPQHPLTQEQPQQHHNGTVLSDAHNSSVSHLPDDNPSPSPNHDPASILAPLLLPPQPDRDRRPQPSTSRRSMSSFAAHHDLSVEQAQTVQALERLTEVTQTLVDQMTALTGLMEQAKQGGGLGAAARVEDRMNRKEKASLAMEMLANPDVGEEVRRAAGDYLKRLFMSE